MTRLTASRPRRLVAPAALLLALLVTATGCVSSEKSVYKRHLTALVDQSPNDGRGAAPAVASRGLMREEPALSVLSD